MMQFGGRVEGLGSSISGKCSAGFSPGNSEILGRAMLGSWGFSELGKRNADGGRIPSDSWEFVANSGQFFEILWDSLGFCGILWDSLGFFGILWDTLGFFGILWDTLGFFGILWDTLGYSGLFGILWNV